MANEFGASPNLGQRRAYSPPHVTDYPAMKWGPNGERKLFQNAAEVPAGWTDNPESLPKAAPAAAKPVAKPPAKAPPALKVVPPAPLAPLTRDQVSAELTAGGVAFQPLAPLPELTELLVASLQTHLTDSKIAFPADADVHALLALVKSPPPAA